MGLVSLYLLFKHLRANLCATLSLQLALQIVHNLVDNLVGECLCLILQSEAQSIRLLACWQLISLIYIE